MSKYQLPTRKGIELFPVIIQQPVAVRFDGVEQHSEDAHKLFTALSGDIDSFYGTQAQAYALSLGEQGSAHRDARDGHVKLSYHNNQGVETVRVHVSTELSNQILKPEEPPKPHPGRYPDFCVVDFIVEDSVDVKGVFFAQCTAPSSLAGLADSDDPDNPAGAEPDRPLFLYSRNGPASAGSIGIPKRVSSLKFDLRQLGETATVTVAIYGTVKPNDYPPTGEFTASTHRTKNYEDPPTALDTRSVTGSISGVLTDSLGNVITNFFEPGPAVEALYNEMLAEFLRPADFTHTTFIPDGQPGHYGTSTYIQVVEDPIYHQVLHRRRLSMSELLVDHTSPTVATWFIRFEEATEDYDLIVTPVLADHYETTCSAAHAFYWDGQDNKHFDTPHQDGSGLWSPGAVAPSRSVLAVGIAIDDHTYPSARKLGTITVFRGSATVKFKPA